MLCCDDNDEVPDDERSEEDCEFVLAKEPDSPDGIVVSDD